MMVSPAFSNIEVKEIFNCFTEPSRNKLLILRELIFLMAQKTPGVGVIEETLKWGQPAYLTSETKSGTTIRLGIPKQAGYALYTHCQTSVMSEFQTLFPDRFKFDGNRAIIFEETDDLPVDELNLLIHRALTYHL